MLEAALAYAALGWSVVPAHSVVAEICSCQQVQCEARGKHPRVRWRDFQSHAATAEQLRAWWTRAGWETSNIAVITGRLSGVVVIDIDPRHGGDESWADWIGGKRADGQTTPVKNQGKNHLRALSVLTPIALTGGGGTHLFFAYPAGVSELRNAADLLPGVDFRGDGGYVIAAPSSHASGGEYAWEVSAHIEDTPLPEMPADVLALVQGVDRSVGGGERKTINFEAIVDGKLRVAEGDRNDAMARLVGWLLRRHDDERTVITLAEALNTRAFDPPLEQRELDQILNSILKRERANKAAAERLAVAAPDEYELDGMPQEDRITLARQIWGQVGVEAVTDWFLLRSERTSYVLVTPEDELYLGADLLAYTAIRRTMLNEGGVLLPSPKQVQDWPEKALALRRLAREEIVEPARASERISEWVESYCGQFGEPEEVESAQRRDALRSGAILVGGRLHLRPVHLAQWLETDTGDRVNAGQLREMLRAAGWTATRVAVGASTTTSAWQSPNGVAH